MFAKIFREVTKIYDQDLLLCLSILGLVAVNAHWVHSETVLEVPAL